MYLNRKAGAFRERFNIDAAQRDAADFTVGNKPFQIGALFVVGDAQLGYASFLNAKVFVYRFPLTFRQIGAHGNALFAFVNGQRGRKRKRKANRKCQRSRNDFLHGYPSL
ncbi:hypothetical protein SDC9_171039 [bioreactor metagenome]|uniref:Uncharacterized protein n=1 Tax=bioreactor metagenome TaxID=1076179 RepID=A0A645GBZ6_9ZZZZ